MRFVLPLALTSLALPAFAEEVNVYSYRQPELIAPLTEAFTEATGIEVNVAYIDRGLVERLVTEGSRSPADIILTVDISRLLTAVDAGVTQPVESEVMTANIPASLRDPDGQWFGLTTRARIVYASNDRVADGEITTYEALADPEWEGRICTRSGTHVYTLALVSAHLYHHGEEATRVWLEALKSNLARQPQGNDRAQVRAIWAGECDISLGNTYYMGKMLGDEEQAEWASSVRILFPEWESGGTHVNVSGVAMTASAPNRDNALAFMEFLASPEAQEIYAEANFEYPVGPGTQAADLVAGWGSFTPDPSNLTKIGNLRGDALRLIEEVDFNG